MERCYFEENEFGGVWRCKILKDMGLSEHEFSSYGDKVREVLAGLSPSELAELGKKYIPGQNAQGVLTFLIEEILSRLTK